jgi:hypothetical protein
VLAHTATEADEKTETTMKLRKIQNTRPPSFVGYDRHAGQAVAFFVSGGGEE